MDHLSREIYSLSKVSVKTGQDRDVRTLCQVALTSGPIILTWTKERHKGILGTTTHMMSSPAEVFKKMIQKHSPPSIGLVGCGNWGKNILRDLLSLGTKVFVADPDPESQKTALAVGALQAVDLSDGLPDLDGYVLAVPIDGLALEAKKLSSRSAPIFSEKTLCSTLAQADDLIASCSEGQIFLMHKWEYHQGVQLLKSVLDSGKIGRLEEIQCVRHNWADGMHGGDVLSCLAVHDLTIVRHILGEIPPPVCSLISHQNSLATRVWAVLGQMPRVVLSVSGRHARYYRTVSLHGSLGTVTLADPLADHLIYRDTSGEEKIPFENPMPLLEELKEFVNYLKGGRKPRCGLERAREVAQALDGLRAVDRQIQDI